MSLAFLTPAAADATAVARSPMEGKAKAAGARFEVRDGWNVAVEYAREAGLGGPVAWADEAGPGGRVAWADEAGRGGPVAWADEAGPGGPVAWADMSHLPKFELQGDGVGGELRTARRDGDAWICPLTPSRALIIGCGSGRNDVHAEVSPQAPGDDSDVPTGAIDVTSPQAPRYDSDVPADAIDVTTCFAALTIFGPCARETIARFCALDLRPQVAPPASFRPGSIARQPGMILVQDTDRFLLLFGWAVGEYMWTIVEDAARSLGGSPVGLRALTPVTEVPAGA